MVEDVLLEFVPEDILILCCCNMYFIRGVEFPYSIVCVVIFNSLCEGFSIYVEALREEINPTIDHDQGRLKL